MLPIQIPLSYKWVSIREVSLPGDMEILKEIASRDFSNSAFAESDDEFIQRVFGPMLDNPDIDLYFLLYKKSVVFLLAVYSHNMNTYEYPRKAEDIIMEVMLNVGGAGLKYASKALRGAVEGFFNDYRTARIVAPVSVDRRNDDLVTVLVKAEFEKIQDQVYPDPYQFYARDHGLYKS